MGLVRLLFYPKEKGVKMLSNLLKQQKLVNNLFRKQ
jgi:hypothetical protein